MANMRKFVHPVTGQKVWVETFACWLFCSLFGSFYFLFKGIYKHALLSFGLAIVTAGISWLIYPFFAPGIVRHSLEEKGYVERSLIDPIVTF